MSSFDDLDAKAEKFTDAAQALRIVDIQSQWGKFSPPPEWILEHYVPSHVVSLLAGHGGTLKSYFALVVAAHAAAGVEFAGLAVTQCRVAFVSLEDPASLVMRRLQRIVEQYDLDEQTVLANFTLIDGADRDAALADYDNAHLVRTRAFDQLATLTEDHGLIVIDNASDAFLGNENARAEVRLFMRWLGWIARKHCAAVLLLAHIDKAAAKFGAQGNSYSGSTAWHNSARSRLALTREDGALVLTHEKCNLGPLGPEMRFTVGDGGVPIPLVDLAPFAQDFTDLIPVMRAALKAGQTVYNNLTPGSHSAMSVLANFDPPKRYDGPAGRRLMAKGIARLIADGKLLVDTYRKSNRHTGERLVIAPVVTLEVVK